MSHLEKTQTQSQSPKEFYETNITNKYIKVLSLSDIHGDLQSLLVAMRDLGDLVRKKISLPKEYPIPNITDKKEKKKYQLMHYEDFSQDTYDDNMEQILLLDLNNYADIYIDDLNYEWCGENTHLVICGDIIDPNRTMECTKDKDTPCSWYPQIELKILMFINALHKQAERSSGKIIKLLGNHELGNILSPKEYEPLAVKYAFKKDRDYGNKYYQNIKRDDIFKVGNPGFDLLIEGGIGVLVKINNTIFVHGDLLENYQYYNDLNQFINNPKNKKETIWANNTPINKLYEQTASLWERKRGTPDDMVNKDRKINGSSTRALQRLKQDNVESDKFCSDLLESFRKFIKGSELNDDENNLKLVIGHCMQNEISTYHAEISSEYEKHNVTYDTLIRSDYKKEVFGETIYIGNPVFDRTDKRTKIFGITMECQIPPDSNTLHRIYRIDSGMSRGFDDYPGLDTVFPSTLEEENKYLYSKTPQMLIINQDGTVEIAKSTIQNARRHVPRKKYEDFIVDKNIEELKLTTTSHEYYYPSPPIAPTNVKAIAGNRSATVTWIAPTKSGGLEITNYTVTSNPGDIIKTVDSSPNTIIKKLTNGTAYTFTVVATNAAGNSLPSVESNLVTPNIVPNAPTNVKAVSGNSEATVKWTAPESNGGTEITSYTITSNLGDTIETADSSPNTIIKKLTNGTAYTFTVVATNAAGNSLPSVESKSVTPNIVPNAPTDVIAVSDNSDVIVMWTAPESNGGTAIISYTITSNLGDIIKNGLTTITRVTGLTNRAYTFTVVATNAAGNSLPSVESKSVTPNIVSNIVPKAPKRVLSARGNSARGNSSMKTVHLQKYLKYKNKYLQLKQMIN
jgi:hypothetical protein